MPSGHHENPSWPRNLCMRQILVCADACGWYDGGREVHTGISLRVLNSGGRAKHNFHDCFVIARDLAG
jgi:hypothetical protein